MTKIISRLVILIVICLICFRLYSVPFGMMNEASDLGLVTGVFLVICIVSVHIKVIIQIGILIKYLIMKQKQEERNESN